MNRLNARKLHMESLEERTLLAVVAGGIEMADVLPMPTEASTWMVNTVADPTSWSTTDTVLSLREAISRAAARDTIVFSSSLTGKTITLCGSELEITKGITIDASKIGGITIDADGKSRVFRVNGGTAAVPVELADLIVTGGELTDGGDGGGIYNDSGVLIITGCTISGNASINGGGIYSSSGTLTITGSAIIGNHVLDGGGGIYNGNSGTLDVTNSVISENYAGSGGGIYGDDGNLTVTNCRIFGNFAGDGGGIYSGRSGVLTVANSAVTGNSAGNYGSGGGIYNDPSTRALTVINCMISENSTGEYGGGIYGSGTLANCTIFGNYAKVGGGIYSGDLTLTNCTVAGNSARKHGGGISGGDETYEFVLDNSIIAVNYAWEYGADFDGYRDFENSNIIGTDPGFKEAPVFVSDVLINIDTLDLSLTEGSLAINSGDNSVVMTKTDLMGNRRIVGGVVDLGAYEYQKDVHSTVVTTFEDIIDESDGFISLREAIEIYATNGDTIMFDSRLAGGTIVLNGTQLSIERKIAIDASGIGGITIDGDGKSRIFHISTVNESIADESISVELTNLKITGGNGYVGGGICFGCDFCEVSVFCKAVLTDCVISGNSANNGGGISCVCECIAIDEEEEPYYFIDVELVNCTVSDNTAGWGGGIYSNGRLTLTNTTVSGNTATTCGGGIYSSQNINYWGLSCATTIINCTISENTAEKGGGICNGGMLTLTNTTVSGNTATTCGGGIYSSEIASIWGFYGKVINCTISNNTAEKGGGICSNSYRYFRLYNTIIAQNSAVNSGNDIYEYDSTFYAYNTLSSYTDWTSDSSDWLTYDSTQPLFTDLENGDYTLAKNSQAIDKGNNSYVETDTDLAANPRIVNGIVDLGAYEYQGGETEQLDAPEISTGNRGIYVSYGANRHQLVWTAIDNASGYELQYSTDGTDWTAVSATDTTAVVTGLAYGMDVQYRVRALGTGSCTDSKWSEIKTFNVCPMDVNGDGDIGGLDRNILAVSWGTEEGEDEYQYYADINADGDVGGLDRNFLGPNWGAESGDDDLTYPKPLAAADTVFAAYESGDLDVDFNVF